MSLLKEQGYRFMVSPNGREADWIHPLDVATRVPGWHDCTEMGDAEFDHFMRGVLEQFPIPFA